MTTLVDAAWAAGLFEGEGCISFQRHPQARGGGTIKLALWMADRDTVERFAGIVGGSVTSRRPGPGASRDLYGVQFTGARAIDVLTVLYDGLGARRRSRADELSRAWSLARCDRAGVAA